MSVRRLLVGLGAMLVIGAPSSAIAKVQEFTVEWSPGAPVAGETVRVTIRFWNDPEHTDPARWPSRTAFEAFLWAFPVGSSPAAPHDAIPIDVASIRRGVMRGEVVLPSAGAWTICSSWVECSDKPEVSGYPGRTALTVSSRTQPETGTFVREAGAPPPRRSTAAPIAISAAAVVAAAGAYGACRSSRRSGRRRAAPDGSAR